ncbi:MAG: transcriptional regulator [Bowdeniella nasicola]|nr:transcriptional regulator [Bowdeniella nasicola]
MTSYYMGLSDIAAHLGLARKTISNYADKGMLPPPDVVVGLGGSGTRGWKQSTIDEWQASRPRAGR